MRKVFVFLMMLAVMLTHAAPTGASAAKKKKQILFPKREYVKRHSRLFFKEVSLTLPVISKVDFFARSEAYPSAYLQLSVYLSKHSYSKTLLPQFAKDHAPLIEAFGSLKKEMKPEQFTEMQEKLKIGKVTFYLLVLHTLVNDHTLNRLSGGDAFKLWNVVLYMTQQSYKGKKKTVEDAAILTASARLIFFKKYKKWLKRAAKILKKVDLNGIDNKDVLLILK